MPDDKDRPAPAQLPGQPRRRPQMVDIARLAGVSVATVSRALNGHPEISIATRERIAELARSLNYTVNAGAKNLRTKGNRTVAVVVPRDPAAPQPISDPFLLAMIGRLADALTSRGYDMLLSRTPADQIAALHASGTAVGIVQLGQWHDTGSLEAAARAGVPLVVWGAPLPDIGYCCVGCDNREGGRLATAHLLEQGRRHIAFIGDLSTPEPAERWQGHVAALQAAGLTPVPALHLTETTDLAHTRDTVQRLLDSGTPVDGIVCCSDILAIAAMAAVRAHGLRVPEDVAVTGYDDISWASHAEPPLTTVRQPIEPAADALVAALMQQAAGEVTASIVLPVELVVRRSSSRG
ncbi:MAG: hypothetical protein RLZZ524_518 [Pseudomonadota bacterium]